MSPDAVHADAYPFDPASSRKFLDHLRELPEGEFVAEDVDDRQPLRSLRRFGAIEVVGSKNHSGRTVHVYELTAEAERFLADEVDDRYTPCPCGHSGFENRGDHYECGFELCDCEFSRDELEVVG